MRKFKKNKLILANSILMLLLIVGCVYAWFAFNSTNTLDSNNVTIVSDNTLELSLDNNTWKNSINLSSDTTWFSDVKFTDITGSGNGTFLRPALNQYPDHAEVVTGSEWTTPTPGSDGEQGDYAEFTLYMRSLEPLEVYLGEGSGVQPSAGSNLTGENVINQSSYSTSSFRFSRDIGVGAVRVSAKETTNGADHLFTWIPRPDIYFTKLSSEAAEYSAETILTDVQSGQYSNNSYTHTYYASEGASTTSWDSFVNGTKKLTGDITNATEIPLCQLNKNESTNYYEGSVTFYIWLEGCDNEARRAFVGGKFNVNLNIVAREMSSGTTG